MEDKQCGTLDYTKEYSEPCETSKMEYFAKKKS